MRSPGSRAKSVRTCQCLRPRRAVWALALSRPSVLPSVSGTTSAPRMRVLSRLNGWPMRSPVNASPMPSRASAHELGVDAVRYSFIVMDLHHLLLAGLPAHSALPRIVLKNSIIAGLRKSRHVRSTVLGPRRPYRARKRHMHRNKMGAYSITSSARCWSWSGTSRPSALAVFRLMISATLIGIWIGSSAAFSPLRMRSMYPAAWGYCSPKSPP